MRTTIAVATFLAVGAGAMGVSALDLKGSDTLEILTKIVTGQDNPTVPGTPSPGYTIDSPAWHDFTNGLTLDCGGVIQGNALPGGLVYVGTGSGAGESALVGNTQSVAPMSRALAGAAGSGVCLSTAALQATAESAAFALDGLSIVANNANFGTVACNGAVQDCDAVGTDPDAGIAFNNAKVIAAPGYVCPAGGVDAGCVNGNYRIFDFKDALRLIYTGMDHDAAADRTKRDCDSAPRVALASNWGNVFQGGTCLTTGCPTGLQHAFRRNASSGTTDVFIAALGLPSLTLTGASAREPFCNAVSSDDTLTGPLPAPPIALGDPANATPPATPATIFFTDFQDRDPIRRVCAGTFAAAFEQVCSARGDLGLVLPIWDAPPATAPNTAFPSVNCSAGKFVNVKGPNAGLTFGLCPNGKAQVGGTCVHPALADGNPVCANTPGNFFVAQGRVDGRVYNLHLHDTNKNYITATRGTGTVAGTAQVVMVGGFYRIHTTRGIPTGSPGCTRESATTQIGCLVGASSPCSLGYAGREASFETGTVALKVGGIDPTITCVRNLLTDPANKYPLSRKLYINTIKGWGNGAIAAGAAERKLGACMTNRTIVDQATIRAGFITFDDTGAQGAICEDFNEQTSCGQGANNNACADTVLPVPVAGP